jgi:regulator of sirC expression with transglutaminase-like and TPR domain
MFELFDEDLDNMELVEGALALNRAIDSDTNVHWAELELARLLKEAELYLANEAD